MTLVKITGLPTGVAIDGTEEMEAVQSGLSVSITTQQILEGISAGGLLDKLVANAAVASDPEISLQIGGVEKWNIFVDNTDDSLNFGTAIVVDASNNVALGGTLETTGNATIGGSGTDNFLAVDTAVNTNPALRLNENGVQKWSVFNDNTDDNLNFYSNQFGKTVLKMQNGDVSIPNGDLVISQGGTAATPKFRLSGSADTGMYTPAASAIGFSTGGTLGLQVDSSQNVSIPNGDIYTTAWTDYSGSSAVVGWLSTTTKIIRYKVIGKFCVVAYDIRGTSNSTAAQFTLPVTASNADGQDFLNCIGITEDNSVVSTTPGLAFITNGSSTIILYSDTAQAGWTASGSKRVQGQIWIEVQ